MSPTRLIGPGVGKAVGINIGVGKGLAVGISVGVGAGAAVGIDIRGRVGTGLGVEVAVGLRVAVAGELQANTTNNTKATTSHFKKWFDKLTTNGGGTRGRSS